MAHPRAIAAAAASSRTSRTTTMSGRDPLLAPSPASATRRGGVSDCFSTVIEPIYLSADEQGPHELVVLVVEDVAVLDISRSGRRGGIEGEHVLSAANPS